MTEQKMDDYRQRYQAGMRAMSKQELDALALEQQEGMRNAFPDLLSHELAQASQNWWAQCQGFVPVEPIVVKPRLTLWQRFQAWREHTGFFKDGADGGM